MSFSTCVSIDVKTYINQILKCNYFTNRLYDMPDLDKKIGYNTVQVSILHHVCGVSVQSDDKNHQGV